MMTLRAVLVLLAGLVGVPASAAADPAVAGAETGGGTALAARCMRLSGVDFSADVGAAVTVRSAAVVGESAALPAYCRVVANVAPRNTVEVRLPLSGWTGRLLMAGCGGLCGAIQMERTDDALARLYAVAHTDMGHAESDLSFANDPEALEDFAHRSTHVATRLLKAVARAHYGRPHAYSYFRGCSTGGRQGLTAALMYPDDYDGIVAGAPAAGAAVPNIAWALKANTRGDGSSILDAGAIGILHDAVLQACDLDDGLKDGIVGHPPACRFDPADVACGKAPPERCLTAGQVDAARSIYAGIRNPDGTRYASLGYAKGGELGWLRGLVRTERPPGMEGVARNYLRRFEDLPEAPRTLADLDFSKLTVRLAPVDALPSFGADGRRIDAFRKAGGKLLLYHSWADDSLTPATAIDVYTAHEQAFGGRAQLDPFLRLFVIPGVFHCRGGQGPDAVDFLDAMVTWVEKQQPPQKLVAFKPARTVPLPGEYRLPLRREEVLFSRPVYAWPASARYSGSGDPKEAGNWVKR